MTVVRPAAPGIDRRRFLTASLLGLGGLALAGCQSGGDDTMADDVQFTGLDISGVQTVGATYGEINMEALLAAAPDLIVTTSYPVDPTLPYGFNDQAQLDQVTAIAPVVAIAQKGVATDVIARNAELAGLLGADLQGQLVTDAKADFD